MKKKVKIEVWICKCGRCDHKWNSKDLDVPRVCPKCKSPYWDKKRVRLQSGWKDLHQPKTKQ